MSSRSLPHEASQEAQLERYLDTLRTLGRDTYADYLAALFSFGIIFFDSSGRIVEATATTEEAP